MLTLWKRLLIALTNPLVSCSYARERFTMLVNSCIWCTMAWSFSCRVPMTRFMSLTSACVANPKILWTRVPSGSSKPRFGRWGADPAWGGCEGGRESATASNLVIHDSLTLRSALHVPRNVLTVYISSLNPWGNRGTSRSTITVHLPAVTRTCPWTVVSTPSGDKCTGRMSGGRPGRLASAAGVAFNRLAVVRYAAIRLIRIRSAILGWGWWS
jgi:hypothetical protein